MSTLNTSAKNPRGAMRVGLWVLCILVAAICVLPYLAVLIAAFSGSTETLAHLIDTVLWRYTRDTFVLVIIVLLGSVVIGTSTAWLVTMTDFKGRRWLEIALALPLALPAYVLAYGYTHILDHPGIVQSTLRDVMGFSAQSGSTFLAARVLGKSPWQAFLTVSLPLARPAIAAGGLLVAMETIADFGTVAHFGIVAWFVGLCIAAGAERAVQPRPRILCRRAACCADGADFA